MGQREEVGVWRGARQDLEGGGTCPRSPSPQPHHSASAPHTASLQRAPSPRPGPGRGARVRGACRAVGASARREAAGGARPGRGSARTHRGALRASVRRCVRPRGRRRVRSPSTPELCTARGGAEARRGGPSRLRAPSPASASGAGSPPGRGEGWGAGRLAPLPPQRRRADRGPAMAAR